MKNHFLPIGLIIGLTFLVYANTFTNEFTYDDHILINENEFIKDWRNLPKIFTRDYFIFAQKLTYRPICTLSYFINYSLWKLNVFGWHLEKIFLHTANAVLIYFLVLLISAAPLFIRSKSHLALLSALFFALHPVQSEVVNCMSFQEDPISFFFFLGAFYFYLRSSLISTVKQSAKKNIFYLMSCGSFAVALFAKEMAITLPLVLILYDWCFSRVKWKRYLPYCLIAGLYLLISFILKSSGVHIQGIPVSSEPIYSPGIFYSRIITMFAVFFRYVQLILFPFRLTIHYIFPSVKSFFEPNILASLGLLALVFIIGQRMRKTYPVISFSLFYFFLVLLPVSNIIPFGAIFQERYLYFSVFGFSLFLALVFTRGLEQLTGSGLRFVIYCFIFVILGLYSSRTFKRNYDWKNDILLWSKVLAIYPESAKADFALADAYCKKGKLDKAIEHYRKVLGRGGKEISSSNRSIICNSLGLIYLDRNDLDSAIEEFKNGLEISPDSPLIHNNLGIAYIDKKEYNLAISEFKKAIEIVPNSEEAYFNLIRVYLDQGEYLKAGETLQQIEKINPQFPRLKRMQRQHQWKR